MKEVNEIIQELNELGSTLAHMPRTMPYSVPPGYFEQLPGNVRANSREKEEELLPELIGHNIPMHVPEGYFDRLPLKMLQTAMGSSEQEKKELPVQPKIIKVIPSIRWAAAAVMALVVTFGGYVMFSGGSTPEKIISSIPGSDISEYVRHSYGLDPNMILPGKEVKNLNVDNKDIVAYLDATGWD